MSRNSCGHPACRQISDAQTSVTLCVCEKMADGSGGGDVGVEMFDVFDCLIKIFIIQFT